MGRTMSHHGNDCSREKQSNTGLLHLGIHKEQREMTFLITKAMKPMWVLELPQSDLQGSTYPWNGLSACRNTHHPKEIFFFVSTKDNFETLVFNSGYLYIPELNLCPEFHSLFRGTQLRLAITRSTWWIQ